MSKASEQMRRNSSLGDEKRDRGLTTPAYVRRFDDIQYGKDPDWNVLDVYRNRYRTGKMPVVMIVHGGGWVYGSKEVYQFYGMDLVRRGFAVVNYSYRLAPEHKFPASLEDTLEVASWIMAHADEYGFDTDRIFAVGDSAGGNLLGLFCSYLYNADYRKQFDFPVPAGIFAGEDKDAAYEGSGATCSCGGFRLRAVGMNCGAYQLFDKDGQVDRPDDLEFMRDLLLGEQEDGAGADQEKLARLGRKYVDVVARVNADFPPAYIMTCQGDFLKAQAPLLKAAYDKAGAEAELHVFGTEDKPLYHVFHCTIQEPEGQRCNDEECDFFRRHMA